MLCCAEAKVAAFSRRCICSCARVVTSRIGSSGARARACISLPSGQQCIVAEGQRQSGLPISLYPQGTGPPQAQAPG
jgi:hypothetical protein